MLQYSTTCCNGAHEKRKRRLYYITSIFTDYADHPFADGRPPVQVRAGLTSTAAGRYQILYHFFEDYKKTLKLTDFSPDSQDAIAIQMIKECKAIPMIEDGNVAGAVKACSSRWASLPFNNYQQGGKSLLSLVDHYNSLTLA